MRTAVSFTALLWLACTPVDVELDDEAAALLALCEGFVCEGAPRCDSGSDCLACTCCPCAEGEIVCGDPKTRWQCRDGCYADVPCDDGTVCVETASLARCAREPGIDCSDPSLPGQFWICGENDDVCLTCGVCQSCFSTGSLCAEDGTHFVCEDDGCFLREPCEQGCVTGLSSGETTCVEDAACEEVGCTGVPRCDSSGDCGACGCCASSEVEDFCRLDPDSGLWERWLRRDDGACHRVFACAAGESCFYDEFRRPVCTP